MRTGYLGSKLNHDSSFKTLNLGRVTRKTLVFSLSLTSLIDAFSILVIFLLIQLPSFETQKNLSEQVPSVSKLTELEKALRVRVSGDASTLKYYVEDKEVLTSQILQNIQSAKSLVIIADRNISFHLLSPIIQAAANAGIEKLQLAATPHKKSGGR